MKLLSPLPLLPQLLLREKRLNKQCVTVFYFWSSDCSLCKRWSHFEQQLTQKLGEQVQCFIIHVGEVPFPLKQQLASSDFYTDDKEQLAALFDIRNFPSIFVFDRQAKLRYKQVGTSETRMLINRIQKFIKE